MTTTTLRADESISTHQWVAEDQPIRRAARLEALAFGAVGGVIGLAVAFGYFLAAS